MSPRDRPRKRLTRAVEASVWRDARPVVPSHWKPMPSLRPRKNGWEPPRMHALLGRAAAPVGRVAARIMRAASDRTVAPLGGDLEAATRFDQQVANLDSRARDLAGLREQTPGEEQL